MAKNLREATTQPDLSNFVQVTTPAPTLPVPSSSDFGSQSKGSSPETLGPTPDVLTTAYDRIRQWQRLSTSQFRILPLPPSTSPQLNGLADSAAATAIANIPDVDTSGLVFRGTWQPFITYNINDVVINNLSSYVAITGSVGIEPDKGNSANWTLLGKNLNFRGVWASQTATIRQNISVQASNGLATNGTFASAVLAGSKIVVSTIVANVGSTTVPAITDSQGNVYSLLVASSRVDGNEYQTQTWMATTAKAGSLTVFVSWTNGTPPGINTMFATEIANLFSSPVEGATSAAVNTTSGPFPSMSLGAANPGDLLYTAVNNPDASLAAPPGFTSTILNGGGIAWEQAPLAGPVTIQWGGSFNSSNTRFTATAVSFFVGSSPNYNPYDYVEFQGSMWVCVIATSSAPSLSNPAWQLLAQGIGFVNVQTSSYLAVTADQGRLISFNSSSPVTLTLPATPPNSGWITLVENIGTGLLTINPNGVAIDGSGSSLTLGQNQGIFIYTNGVSYFTFHCVNRITVPSFFTASAPDDSGNVTIASATVSPSFALIGPTICAGAGPITARQIQGSDLLNLNASSAFVIGATATQSGNLRLCGSVLPAGLWRISVYMVVTDPGAGTLSATLTWNDGTASQTTTPASISTTTIGTVAQFDFRVLTDGIHDVSYTFTLA